MNVSTSHPSSSPPRKCRSKLRGIRPTGNKKLLVQQIVQALEAELEGYARSARAAHAEATDDQSKAENKYDTRGLEASYLAQGQSRQAAEVARAIQQYEALGVRDFEPGEVIGVGAIVELRGGGSQDVYFIGPAAGGTEIAYDRKAILVLTPQSPLGQQLMGKKQGERVQLARGRSSGSYEVVTVR